MKRLLYLLLLCLCICCRPEPSVTPGGESSDPAAVPKALVSGCLVDGRRLGASGLVVDVPIEGAIIEIEFSSDIDAGKFMSEKVSFSGGGVKVMPSSGGNVLRLSPENALEHSTGYTLSISAGAQLGIKLLDDFSVSFSTVYDPSDKFPKISSDALLDLVQERTFRYFWDYAHPESGLARERLGSGNTVTAGGSGFGIMAVPVGIERGFITRSEGAERMRRIVSFLSEKADRFHGAFPHWMDGQSGKALPFSSKDNGADLVETAFLMEGLLAARQYFDRISEADIASGIEQLWKDVEWDWFTRGEDVLYWHWSPDKEWAINMQIKGWNEALLVYVLAASSPTHPVEPSVYHKGWASDGVIRCGRSFYDITLPLGYDKGGPMFFAHYSFMGLDPRNLSDGYASYWEQNVAHARINHAYCADNPGSHSGYGPACWGLTASDYPKGYTASSPTNDTGTIAPTAALASMPYTPKESMAALETFYYIYGDKLWGEYGFYDSFNLDSNWFASSYIAIDQGPIVVMIENSRSGLLWNLFMKDADVRAGLEKLGFEY